MKNSNLTESLGDLYLVDNGRIRPGSFWDGDECTMIFESQPDKYMRISSDDRFTAFTERVFIEEWEDYSAYVNAINARYGTAWDEQRRQLYIRFRRNEMSVSDAVARLHGAMMLVAALDWHVFV